MTAPKPLRDLLMTNLVARLAVRWPSAGTHIPDGGKRVLCLATLPEHDQAVLDAFILGYMECIDDVAPTPNPHMALGPPTALEIAKASAFQSGSASPRTRPSQNRTVAKKARGRRPFSAARQKAEELFSRGGHQ